MHEVLSTGQATIYRVTARHPSTLARCLLSRRPSQLYRLFLNCLFIISGLLANPLAQAQTDSRIDIDSIIFEHSNPVRAPAANARAEAAATTDNGRFAAHDFFASDGELSATGAIDNISRYRAAIENSIASNGPFAAGLVQDYYTLGLHYQQANRHTDAIEAFEEAQYINRVNFGLVTEELFNLVKAEITSHIALGDLSSANREKQYLYYLGREYYGSDSPELVPVLDSLADWHMDSFSMGITRKPAFRVSINNGPGGGGSTPDQRFMALGSLYRADQLYGQAIENLLNNRNIQDPRLPALERKLIETTFFTANRSGLMDDPVFYLDQRRSHTGTRISLRGGSRDNWYFRKGNMAYERLRTYLYYQPGATILDLAAVMIEEADWLLLHDHHGSAINRYEEAVGFLRDYNVPEDNIRDLFRGDFPVKLPVFTALPHTREFLGIPRDAAMNYLGYIDVSFRVSRYGSVRRLDVEGRSEGITDMVEKRLRQWLHSTPFRPDITTAEYPDNHYRLRYHVSQAATPR